MNATELKEKHRKELAELETKEAIIDQVPEHLRPLVYMVHVHTLYGVNASIKFGDSYQHDKRVTWAQLIDIAEAFPAAPLVMVRDSCLSFRPQQYVDALPEVDKARWESEINVAPFTVTIKRDTCKIEWNTQLCGKLVEIECYLPYTPKLGRMTGRRSNYMGGFSYKDRGFIIDQAFQRIERDGEPLAETQGPRAISWWSPDYHPGRYTLAWIPLRDDMTVTPADLARQVIGQP